MSAVEITGARRVRSGTTFAVIFSLICFFAAPAMAAPTTTFSVVVPIVAVESGNELLTVDELSAATSPGGIWFELSSAAISHGATLAVDSRIVASIVALGNDTPAGVASWLSDVTTASPLYLPWGNADPLVLASFAASYRISTIALSKISTIPAGDFVGWPTGNAGKNRILPRLETLGFSTLIVDDVSFPDAAGSFSAEVTDQIRSAVAPGSTVSPQSVAAEILRTSNGSTVIALPRNPRDIDPLRAAEFLDALLAGPEAVTPFRPVSLDAVGKFRAQKIPTVALRNIEDQHRLDRDVSAIAANPSVISTPRLRRFCVMAGMIGQNGFSPAARSYVQSSEIYDEFISFTIGADFTVLADSAELPLTVSNSTASDITVVARVNAVSGIVNIANPQQTITVPAGSSAQVSVPMVSVANGKTSIRATLTTVDGIPVSEPVYVAIDVQAEWEGLTLIAFIAVVSTILSIGIVRTVRDRRARS
ncbi:MAG: DUF6049 family protein [Microbacteriaceae bacterium]|nr:DUF6049 family protein [Microbacteriaceae bacterium]